MTRNLLAPHSKLPSTRPWILFFREPIVLLAIYMAIVYGTLNMLFAVIAYSIWDKKRYNCAMSILNYFIYTASVLAANSVLRSLFGAAFPLFTSYIFANLGIHWASSVPAFLGLAFVLSSFFVE